MTATVEDPAMTEIALLDLSSIAYPIFLTSTSEPDPDYTSMKIVERVRALTANHPYAAVCCDSGRSFRHDISPSYKAQRTQPANAAALHHQIRLAVERLQADGYPAWAVKGFEADDLIASATALALGLADVTVLIITGDKDLFQLVQPRVRAMSVRSGTVYDVAGVAEKFGVKPHQIRDYLALCGDPSDNIKGAKGIGPKTAAMLLNAYGSLDGIYANLNQHGTQFKPALATSLREFEARRAEVLSLVTLRTDAVVPFLELDTPRTPRDAGPMEIEAMNEQIEMPPDVAQAAAAPEFSPVAAAARQQQQVQAAIAREEQAVERITPTPASIAVQPDVLAAAPHEFERQLEPRSLPQAMQLANAMHKARMFNGYGAPEAVLSTILAGRELGLQAIASLRGFHVIEGKHALAADAMRGLVLRSGQAKYFRVVERTPERATFETWRAEDPEPIRLTYTREEGYAAFKPELPDTERKKKWDASAWGKHPADMCAARASSKLARLVYSDILFGLYAPEELRD
jgi:5'-3' exonuclease